MGRNDEEDDEQACNPTISAAFNEIEAVLDKYGLGGTILVATQDDAAWVTHFPKWSLLDTDGSNIEGPEHFAKHRPGESIAEAARRTIQLVGALVHMADEVLTWSAGLDCDLTRIFVDQGMVADDGPLMIEDLPKASDPEKYGKN